jgi:hypothetical protein
MEREMKFLVKNLVAVAALAGLAGCATYDYGYGYGYGEPYTYSYDYGPVYYGPYYSPGYYVAPPVIGFSYRYYGGNHHGDRDYHGGDRWRHSDWSRARTHVVPRTASSESSARTRAAPARVAGGSRATRANGPSRQAQRAERFAGRDQPRG